MKIDETLNNWFLFIHVSFISEFCSGISDLLNLHQHSPNDSAGGVSGDGERLMKWLGYGYSFIVILISS